MSVMSYKGFKKVAQDEHTATFRHEKFGHEIKIAHKKLTPKLKGQLDAIPIQKLAGGGGVMPSGPCMNPGCHSYGKPHPNCHCGGAYAQGGEVSHKSGCPYAGCQKFSSGGAPVGESKASEEIHPFDALKGALSTAASQEEFDKTMESLPKSPEEERIMSQEPIKPAATLASTSPTAGLGQLPMSPPEPTATTPAQTELAPQGRPGGAYDEYQAANQEQLGALEQQKVGAQAEALTRGNMQAAQGAHERAYQADLAAATKTFNDTMTHLNDQEAKLQQDVANGHIDPKRYLNSMTTGGKIATGIGLILGGMGAGLTRGPNTAFQYLQSQIDRDIDAQRTDLGKKQNLLAHNIQLMGNARAGMDLTRLQHLDILNSQIRAEAGKAGTPMAQAQALAIEGEIGAKKAEIKRNMAIQRTMMGGGGSADPESQFQSRMQFLRMNGAEGMAKDLESKHVAGIPGQASVELTAENRNDLQAKHNFDQKLGQYIEFAQKNGGSLNPQVAAHGKALAAELQGLYRQATHGGVYKEGEAHFIDQLIDSNPTKFFNTWRGVIPKAQALLESNRDSLGSLKKSLGFPEQAQTPHPHEGKTATNGQGQRIVMKNGRWVPYGG